MNKPILGDRCFGVIHNPTPRRKQIMPDNYDNMNVHELVVAAKNEGWLQRIEPGSDGEYYLPAIESALRRKVIEEASVGTGTFTGEYGIGMYGEYEPQEGFLVNVEGEHDTDVVYDLIPHKETP